MSGARCDCDSCRGRHTETCACGHPFADHKEPWHICTSCLFCGVFRASRDGR